MRAFFSVILMCVALALVACSPGQPSASEAKPKVAVSESPSAEEIASLAEVDTSVKPTGPSVSELISVEDVKEIIGRDDIVLAVAT